MALKLYPYTMGSESGKQLADLLNIKRVRPDGDYVPRIHHSVVNWGSSRIPDWMGTAQRRGVKMLNKPEAVAIASNKLEAFKTLISSGVAVPQFTISEQTANEWVQLGHTVIERHILRGNSGEGIRIVNLDDDSVENYITPAPLYTKFVPKMTEFRVHVFRGRVIDICEKKKRSSENRPENFNRYICSTEVGWVFARNNIRDIPAVKDIAIRAVAALGLDFGAVDVMYHEDRPLVLEVNTAPGLMGTTLVNYANAFRRYIGQPDLPESVVSTVVEREQPLAAVNTSVGLEDAVTLRLDRATALKLKTILSGIV